MSSGGAVDVVAHIVKFMGIQLRWGFSPPPLFSRSAKSKLSSHSFLESNVKKNSRLQVFRSTFRAEFNNYSYDS